MLHFWHILNSVLFFLNVSQTQQIKSLLLVFSSKTSKESICTSASDSSKKHISLFWDKISLEEFVAINKQPKLTFGS